MRKKENYIKHSVLQKVYGKIGKKKSPRKGGFFALKKSCIKVASRLQNAVNVTKIL